MCKSISRFFSLIFFLISQQEEKEYQLVPTTEQPVEKKPGWWSSFLKSFSIPFNAKRLGMHRKGPLDFLNGIRVISMAWVISSVLAFYSIFSSGYPWSLAAIYIYRI